MTNTLRNTIRNGQTGDLYKDFARGWTYRHNGTGVDCLSTTDGTYVAPKGELALILRNGQPAVDPTITATQNAKDIAIAVRVCTMLHKRFI